MDVSFVETEAFTAEVLKVANEETLRQFQMELAANPESGKLLRQGGGLRKVRMKLEGRGKSAGARVIYLWLPDVHRVVLIMLYTKAKQTSIPSAQLARVRELAEKLRGIYNR